MTFPRGLSKMSRQIATKSALNPIQWITAICFPIGVISARFFESPLNYIIVFVSSMPVFAAVYSFLYFTHKNADRLQSEQHIENMQVLARIGSGESGIITLESGDDSQNSSDR